MIKKSAFGQLIGFTCCLLYFFLFFFFVDENHLYYINCDAKVYDFINSDSKEWNLHSIFSILPLNVLVDIKAIPILSSLLFDRIFWSFSQYDKFTHKLATWTMKKPLEHARSKILHLEIKLCQK